jgi:hypothetical protein
MEQKIRLWITTHYESFDSEHIEPAEFVKAVEGGFGSLPSYSLLGKPPEVTQDYFGVLLGFATIDHSATAVSAVLTFHDALLDCDYFLQHWTGHFRHTESLDDAAGSLTAAVNEALAQRVAEGWWEG